LIIAEEGHESDVSIDSKTGDVRTGGKTNRGENGESKTQECTEN